MGPARGDGQSNHGGASTSRASRLDESVVGRHDFAGRMGPYMEREQWLIDQEAVGERKIPKYPCVFAARPGPRRRHGWPAVTALYRTLPRSKSLSLFPFPG